MRRCTESACFRPQAINWTNPAVVPLAINCNTIWIEITIFSLTKMRLKICIQICWNSIEIDSKRSKRLQVGKDCDETYLNCWKRREEVSAMCSGGNAIRNITKKKQRSRCMLHTISQTRFSNVFSWIKMYELRLIFHCSLFTSLELTIWQHWFRYWLGAGQAII